jgi:hypothetical protein
MLSFHPHLDIRHNQDGKFVSSTLRSHFTRREIQHCIKWQLHARAALFPQIKRQYPFVGPLTGLDLM